MSRAKGEEEEEGEGKKEKTHIGTIDWFRRCCLASLARLILLLRLFRNANDILSRLRFFPSAICFFLPTQHARDEYVCMCVCVCEVSAISNAIR